MASADIMMACEHRFRYAPRKTVASASMHGAFVAESVHEGPFSFDDDLFCG